MIRRLLVLALVSLVTLACGEGRKPNSDDTPKPNEETLRRQLTEEWEAFVKEDWSAMYSMQSAEQRASCTLDEWTERVAILPIVYGDSLRDAKVEITDVKISGDRATYSSVILIDGRPRDEPSTGEVVWDDGRWRQPGVDPCE